MHVHTISQFGTNGRTNRTNRSKQDQVLQEGERKEHRPDGGCTKEEIKKQAITPLA